jgi:hypothetical protein
MIDYSKMDRAQFLIMGFAPKMEVRLSWRTSIFGARPKSSIHNFPQLQVSRDNIRFVLDPSQNMN